MTVSANDAHPYPIYNARYRVVFPILDADGDLVSGAGSLDSELSQDQGTFADATNEATEIATSSGMYYLDLTAGELDTKSTAVIIKSSSGKTTPLVLYPVRLPQIRTGTAQAGAASTITLDSSASAIDDYYIGCYVNITNNSPANAQGQARRITDYVGSTKVATIEGTWGTNPSSASTFEILAAGEWIQRLADVNAFNGTAGTFASGRPEVNTTHIAGSAVSTSSAQIGVNVVNAGGTAWASGAITAAAIATGAIDADAIADGAIDAGAIAADAITAAKIADGAIDANTFASGAITAAAIAADAIGASELAADAVAEIADAVWDEAASGHTTSGTFGQALNIVRAGTAQAGAAGTITLDASASASDDFYNNTLIVITGGTGAGQARMISDYVGSTKVASVNGNWVTNPDNTSVFVVLPFGALPGATAPTAGEVADAVWDEARSGHVSAGSFGEYIPANVSHFGGSAGTFASGRPEVNTTHWKGTAAATVDTAGYPVVTVKDGTGAGEIALTGGAIDTVTTVNGLASGAITAAAIATGAIDADALATDAVTEIRSTVSGAADSGSTTTMVDSARTEADTDYWKGSWILFTSGNISGQTRLITAFDPATDTLTFVPATTQAVSTQTYEIIPAARVDLGLWLGVVMNALQSGRVDSYLGAGANDVITAAMIATGAIDADAIADNAIDAGAIAADAITAAKIATGAIDADALAADAVTEIQAGLATSANQTTLLNRIGTPTDLGGGATLSANLVDIEGQTDDIGSAGAGLTAVPWNAAWDAEVQSEVQDALESNNLDHLAGTATGIPAVPAGTYLDQIMDDGTASFDRTTDSLQAIRDRGDAAWTTGGGGSITDILNIQPLIPISIDLANTATWRLGLLLYNALDDLPSTAEITPGVISIDRKAIGGTSWSSVVSDAACSESAGLVYYDEVFDGGTGYAEGDSIQVTFKSQKITVSANDYEISDSTGRIFYTEIRQTERGTNNASTLDAAGVRTAVGLASANLDTQLSAIDDYLDTEVAAIKAKTDQLTFTTANKVDATLQAAADFAQAAADKVWSSTTRTLSAFGFSVTVGTNNDKTGYSLSAAGVQAIWDALTAALATAGSIGKLLVDNINATIGSRASQTSMDAVDDLVDDLEGRLTAARAGYLDNLNVGGNVASSAQITALNNLSAAQVNAEVVDALNVDTYAEPGQEAPPATTTLVKKIGYLYKTFRNRKTQTATTLNLYADNATTVDQKATVSDDGTTYDHGEIGTGP